MNTKAYVSTIISNQSVFKEVISTSNVSGSGSDGESQQKKQVAIDAVNFDKVAEAVIEIYELEASNIVPSFWHYKSR